MVDYSKWDKLELSDDSDIEVHPNVDKKSFIRWKQRDIHEKREQQRFRIAQLEVNIETNEDLLRRVQKLIAAGEKGHKLGLNVEGDVALAQEGETKSKPAKATSPEQPLYADMMESMLMQIVAEDGKPEVVLSKLREHADMITNALTEERKELDKIEAERKQHITAEDIRTGWDSTIVYKSDKSKPQAGSSSEPAQTGSPSSGATTSTQTTVETLNKPAEITKPKMTEDGLEELLPATAEFGKLPTESLDTAFHYLMKHPYIVTEGQKDALLMTAFEHELSGKPEVAKRVVWNSLLIQYSAVLGKDGVRLFFSRIVKPDHPARLAFEKDAETTYNHIKGRCEVLSKEHDDAEPQETIQLHAVDPDTALVISVPEKGTPGYEIYEKFSPEVRQAIDSQQLDKINEVLGSLKVEDAEALVGELSESGVLQVENKIYEQQEWDAKKEQLVGESPDAEAAVPSSVDEVD